MDELSDAGNVSKNPQCPPESIDGEVTTTSVLMRLLESAVDNVSSAETTCAVLREDPSVCYSAREALRQAAIRMEDARSWLRAAERRMRGV
jgi:hypothetical protein